jgi:ABC-2 type transport system permease protein
MAQTFSDGIVVTKRNLLKIKRVPELLVFATLSPIMFVLLFAFVFGSAIPLPGVDYKVFLMAGIFTQTVIFGATITGVSIAEDLQKGLIDRFRSLPMAQSAVLVGRTNADVGNNVLVLIVMSLTGLLVGWRITTNIWEALAAYVLLLAFAYAISWVMATIGLLVKAPEVVNNAAFIVIFPLTFIANTFVPTENFPAPLKAFANWNPVSSVTQSVRELFGNASPMMPPPDIWPGQHPVAYSVIWIVIMLVVFVPLSVRMYKNAANQ